MSKGTERMDSVGQTVGGELKTERYRFVIISILGLATLANFLILFNLGVLLPSISEDLGLSPSEQGWLGSSAILANLIVSLPLGWWLSKMNAKWIVTITLVGSALFLFVQGWAPIFAVLVAGRVLFGILGVAREPARAMLTQQWVPKREVVLVNGLLTSTIGMAIAVGLFLTPLMLVWFDDDWRATFYVYAAATLAIGVIWHLMGRERITKQYSRMTGSQQGNPLRSLFRYGELWAMGFGVFGANMLWMAFVTFWPTQVLEDFEVSLFASGTLLAVGGVVTAVFGLLFSWATYKWAVSRPILVLCGVLTVTTSIAMTLTDSMLLLTVLTILNGIGWSFFPLLMTLPFYLPKIKPREIAVAVGFYETAMWAGGAVGPALAGILQEITDSLQFTLIVISPCGFSLVLGALFVRSLDSARDPLGTTSSIELAPLRSASDPGPIS